MKWQVAKTIPLLAMLILLCSNANISVADSVEWTTLRTLQLEEPAIDVAISSDGTRVFVLTRQGKIIVYSSIKEIEAEIDVGKDVTQMKLGAMEDTLILNDRKNKTLKLIALDFIQNINVSGSPFKGPEDAPVVVAVFSDFE
jgi:hypothetical protein